MASPQDDDLFLVKLDVLKDIRSKTIHLEKLKVKILQLMQTLKTEDDHMSDYKAEVEHLKREKVLLIESLRHIEQDLCLMEGNIAEARQKRERIREKTCSLFDEYTPLKLDIDSQRMQIGLTKLTDIPGRDLISAERSPNGCRQLPLPAPAMAHSSSHEPYVPTMYSRDLPSEPGSLKTMTEVRQHIRRQQKPPMKTCASCQELIHRNAPVCPMCKAKSKSKNPKKPKRTSTVDE